MKLVSLRAEERSRAGEFWMELEARLEGGLACSWVWTDTWLDHFGDVVPHWIAVGLVAGEPRGVALLTRGMRRQARLFNVDTLHLGTAGEPPGETVYVEYNRVLVAPAERGSFAAAVVAAARDDPHWDEFALDGFAPEDAEPFLQASPDFEVRHAACPVVDLRGAQSTGGQVLPTLRASTQRRVRQSLEAFGPLEVEWAETPEHGLDILDELITLHTDRWRRVGLPGAFSKPRRIGFHRSVVCRLFPSGAVLLFRVRSRRGTVGCLYGFIERRRVLFYQSGLAPSLGNRQRPGFVAHALCMQACYERGLHEYDFLVGDSRYKEDFATVQRPLVWAVARRPRPKVLALQGLRRARHLARRLGGRRAV